MKSDLWIDSKPLETSLPDSKQILYIFLLVNGNFFSPSVNWKEHLRQGYYKKKSFLAALLVDKKLIKAMLAHAHENHQGDSSSKQVSPFVSNGICSRVLVQVTAHSRSQQLLLMSWFHDHRQSGKEKTNQVGCVIACGLLRGPWLQRRFKINNQRL